MILYIDTIQSATSGRYRTRIVTKDGMLVAQVINEDRELGRKRAVRVAYEWGTDRNWGELVFIDRPERSGLTENGK